MTNKLVKIGTYESGYEKITLWGENTLQASFVFLPNKEADLPQIYLGFAHTNEATIYTHLVHEIFEFQMDRHSCRYYPRNNTASENGAYLFVMDHMQFSDVAHKAAEFIDAAWPDARKAWKIWHKKQKSNKK